MTKPRVLVLTTTFPRWKDDSTPAFVYDLSKKLKGGGFEIIALSPHHQGAKKAELMGGIRVYRFPYFYPLKYQKLAYDGGVLSNLRRSRLAKIQAPLLFLSELFYTFKIIREEKIDIIHSHWIIPNGLIGAVCRKVLGVGHILTIHGSDQSALERLPFKRIIAGFIVKNSDGITVVSNNLQDRLFYLLRPEIIIDIRNKVYVIPMGVNLTQFKYSNDKDALKSGYGIKSKKVLLFIGRLVENKGLSYLIESMPKILSRIHETELIVCGDGPLRKDYEELVRRRGLADSVRFTGYVIGKEKIDYFHLSDMLVVPSIVTDSGETEGLPVVILEGFAAGTPVIANDVGGIGEIIKDGFNGFLTHARDNEDLSEKIVRLLTDEKLRKEFSLNGLETVKEFSLDKNSEKFGRIYHASYFRRTEQEKRI